jgi:NADPH2:quinone reductase
VCAVTQGGGFAGEVVIKQGGVVKLPDNVDLVAAAGLPVIFGTAHLAIKERAQVKAGNGFPHHQWSYLLPDFCCSIQLQC